MTLSEALRARVRQQAHDQCGYCRISSSWVYASMEIDHILPRAAGGSDDEDNLWLSCPICNQYKHTQTQAVDPLTRRRVPLYNPRVQSWDEHFRWGRDQATIIGRTACGRATVKALRLNIEQAVQLRRGLVEIGAYPPGN
jgi:hypothetical protein